MGRVKRFSILNVAIKKYGATGGTAITKYKSFRAGTSTYKVNGTSSVGRNIYTLKPFGVKSTDPAVLIQASERAFQPANLGFSGLALTDLNLTVPKATDNDKGDTALVPAKAIVKFNITAGAATPSQITGVSYKKSGGNSATYPFGRGTGTEDNYRAVQSQIAIAVATGTANRSVTFKPERFY